jgi:hypothetical protein
MANISAYIQMRRWSEPGKMGGESVSGSNEVCCIELYPHCLKYRHETHRFLQAAILKQYYKMMYGTMDVKFLEFLNRAVAECR